MTSRIQWRGQKYRPPLHWGSERNFLFLKTFLLFKKGEGTEWARALNFTFFESAIFPLSIGRVAKKIGSPNKKLWCRIKAWEGVKQWILYKKVTINNF